MCGLAGYVSYTPIERASIRSMLAQISYRGPDETGYYHNLPYHAGMCRLAINGIEDGQQPLFNQNEDVVLLYNGEIYNADSLRQQLIAKGYRFKTHSDGEVICHLYDEMGEALFEQLDGMFAIALWIQSEQKLILARDFPGEKPLYYRQLSDNELIFASEIKAFNACGQSLSLNQQAIWDFPTFLWIPEPATIYNEIEALPPGHMLVVTSSGMTKKCFKSLPTAFLEQDDATYSIEALKHIVEESVHTRLLSEAPIACSLSSGLDSSIVTTLARKKVNNLRTYSIGFEALDDPYHGKSDESKAASILAEQLDCLHTTINVTGSYFRSLLDTFCHHGDQPFAVSSGLGILAIAEKAHQDKVKVLLSGDGADECFGGYSWYEHINRVHSTASNREQLCDIISMQNTGLSLEKRLAALACLPDAQKAWAFHYYAHEKEKQALFNPEWFGNIESSIRHFENHKSSWSPTDYIRHDQIFYFPNEMLTKLDRMCMAFSVEPRVPFGAYRFQEFASQFNINEMIRGNTLKWPLREAVRDLLPNPVIKRPKHGFNVPIDHWLKNEWYDLLTHTFSKDSKLFQLGMINEKSLNIANQMLNHPTRLNGHTLFCFIMLNKWLENEYCRNYC